MDLSDRQRKLVFAGLVVVLAAVGIYLTLPSSPEKPPTRAATAPLTPAAITPAPGAENFNIYPLLPFSQKEFAAAAELARQFTASYGTYRYDEDPQTYVGRLQGMVSGSVRDDLIRSSSAPGLIEERQRDQVVAQGSAQITSIRDIQKNSIIFVVTGNQNVTKAGKASKDNKQYAVTVARAGGGWTVYAFLPADEGNEGDAG